jgi:membrane protease YdiL (CAAX protease family)
MSAYGIAAAIIGLALACGGPPLVAILAKSPSTAASLAAIGASAVIVAAVLLIATQWEGLPLAAIGLRPPGWKGFALGLAVAALFIAVIGPVLMRMPGWFGWQGFDAGLWQAAAAPGWLLLLSILVVASAEEVPYRGYAIERLEALTGSTILACALSAALFALAHVPMWGWGASSTTLVSGAIFAALYAWQRDLFPLVIAHVATDIAGLLLPRLMMKA